MSSRLKPLSPLQGEQLRASDPGDLVWLSASAGTGKTHVLTARVLRLLLSGVRPETILCLTFTKAGAAEMADRIHARLAHWVRLPETKLRQELASLGEKNDDDAIRAARRLFAQVLDAPGGGLRIQTIHAFCQTLLSGFPAEAGLSPGFRPIEDREGAALARQTLAELLVEAERGGDLALIDDLRRLSLRLGEGSAEAYLRRCARAAGALAELGPRQGIEARVRTALDLPLGDVEEEIVRCCTDDRFDLVGLRAIAAANATWGTKTGLADADKVATFLGASADGRAGQLATLLAIAWTQKGEPRSYSDKLIAAEPGYAALCARMATECARLLGLRARAQLAAHIAGGLRAGQAYALAYAEAKKSAGLVDFDDLIRATVDLLARDGIGDWVRYKLDQATDHILVDEAQDTNGHQWAIVNGLVGEFFAGEGAKGDTHRTMFTVGDYKQAIFGFQGTDPIAFRAAREYFGAKAEMADRAFVDLSLDRSFRSTPPILELVDQLIAELGHDELGVDGHERHVSARHALPGRVTLWAPVAPETDLPADDEGEEDWIDDTVRTFARKLAQQIRQWIDDKLWVAGKGRPLRPEDILILVRKRRDLAALIVARLHAEGVPVAGVDRLRLNAPLGVRDLLAAVRFVLQPEDDLNLAGLLVSPLIGWDQQRLYDVGHGRKGPLWRAVRESGDIAADALHAMLAMADLASPHAFLEHILSGPLQGRRRLLERLGEEARDPIEELLNAALGFETQAMPTLQRFLDWFDRGEVEITRDPAAPTDAVRVMTVHGSKGLQAPMVILADATGDPETSRREVLDWAVGEGAPVPVLQPRREERCDMLTAVSDEARQRDLQEHWRLLYVALTRAEEHLVIGGALGRRAKDGEPPEKSWYRAVRSAMETLGAEELPDQRWASVRHWHGTAPVATERVPRRQPLRIPLPTAPDWLRKAAPPEARPPRPLAPSAIGVDRVADPPPGPAMMEAARRGRLIHALFERLPPIAPERRREAGLRWLRTSAGVADATLVDQVCAIMADPEYTELFAPDSLAEAPIAAIVGAQVVAGTVDRLLIRDDVVRLVDFKTGRRVPASDAQLPDHHVAQMAAYVAALETVFPGRPIEASLLYTAGPKLYRLSSDLLEQQKILALGR